MKNLNKIFISILPFFLFIISRDVYNNYFLNYKAFIYYFFIIFFLLILYYLFNFIEYYLKIVFIMFFFISPFFLLRLLDSKYSIKGSWLSNEKYDSFHLRIDDSKMCFISRPDSIVEIFNYSIINDEIVFDGEGIKEEKWKILNLTEDSLIVKEDNYIIKLVRPNFQILKK